MKHTLYTKDLREWVAIEEPIIRMDEQGGYITEWHMRHSCWACIEPVMPSLHDEAWHVGQHITSCRYRVWMRGDFPVTPKMRLAWGQGEVQQYLSLLSAPVFLQQRAFQTFMTQVQT